MSESQHDSDIHAWEEKLPPELREKHIEFAGRDQSRYSDFDAMEVAVRGPIRPPKTKRMFLTAIQSFDEKSVETVILRNIFEFLRGPRTSRNDACLESLGGFRKLNGRVNLEGIIRWCEEKGVILTRRQLIRVLESFKRNARSRSMKSIREMFSVESVQESFNRLRAVDCSEARFEFGRTVLAAARLGAKRVFEKAQGEGIPLSLDLEEVRDRSLDSVVAIIRQAKLRSLPVETVSEFAEDAAGFLSSLTDYCPTVADDLEIASIGSRLALRSQGIESVIGLIAFNLQVVINRTWLSTRVFVDAMLTISELAYELQHQPHSALEVEALSVDVEFPPPIRVASRSLDNAITLILARVLNSRASVDRPTDFEPHEIEVPLEWQEIVYSMLDRIRERDPAYPLLDSADLMFLATQAEVSGNHVNIDRRLRELGEARVLSIVEEVEETEDNALLEQLIIGTALRVFPRIESSIHS